MFTNKKLLSVIVPTFNMGAYLAKNLSSVMISDKALRSRLEVIVVNDGSTDNSLEIAQTYATNYPEAITIIDKPNGHYGSCINAALTIAKGAYIRVLDADDYANHDAFERFLAYMTTLEHAQALPDLFISNVCCASPTNAILKHIQFPFPTDTEFSWEQVPRFRDFIMLHALTYRTAILRDLNYRQTEGCAYTDIEWDVIPMSRVRTIRYFNEAVMYYLVGRDGQTMQSNIFMRDFHIVIQIYRQLAERYADLLCHAAREARQYLTHVIQNRIWYLYRFCFFEAHTPSLMVAIHDFDLALEHTNPTLYAQVSSVVPAKKAFQRKYLTAWRKHIRKESRSFTYYECYARILVWLRHKKRAKK